MDYLFENLGDERFQEFCSSLILQQYPNTQSFPVGQPDGGRDSISYIPGSTEKEFIVFQVKYVRNPNSLDNPHKWLSKIIEEEAKKVNTLILKGAKQFFILTNVKGTAHLDNGTIDKVNRILEENISIPAICWWRDDLSRLIEQNPIFKWSYPEILNGQDVLNSILFENITENKSRRQKVIKAYLADQYLIDNEVKFKQIDLQNKLLDLFTDVPIRLKKINEKNKTLKRTIGTLERLLRKPIYHSEPSFFFDDNLDDTTQGAASFLLHPKVQNDIERVLLEGGPGQGKSTISQYICQVHRVRLLEKKGDINLIPENIKKSPIRLPFKFDLRHIALWVEEKNPYIVRLNDEQFKSIWRKSLESFIIGHISYHSQSENFNTDDLLAILSNSSALFVFDGFDEIADLKIRREVVNFINKGIARIKENAKSIQVLITSRPAAFSDTIGFSIDEYPHFQLSDVTPNTTKEYVEKWVKVSKLDGREASHIKKLVNEKLQLPHLKDLTKSPMQLAIFLSLLRTRGESLPNKRTALYDSYIELFFNRESEKDKTIRDHRDLIIDIHQYLAWILHSEAELLGSSGSISIEDLKLKVKAYLEKEGHETDITDKLFHVLKERVCALVSRVQGTYEFEVQPLREYFCAKYLYNTSPYSPSGKERTGTKPERFNTIARNPYWNNVVRFFAGCFDKGELPMLIHELKDLKLDDLLCHTNYPSFLTSQILSDWVFTQYPKLLKEIVNIIVSGINVGSIISQDNLHSNAENIILPNECGRKEIFNECFAQLRSFPKDDYANDLITILRNNPLETEYRWQDGIENFTDEEIVKWLEYAYLLEIMHLLDDKILEPLIIKGDRTLIKRKIQILLKGRKTKLIYQNKVFKESLLDGVSNLEISFLGSRKIESYIQIYSLILNPFIVIHILRGSYGTNESYLSTISHIYLRGHNINDSIEELKVIDEVDEKIKLLFSEILNSTIDQTANWGESLIYWDYLIETSIKYFGENLAIKTISIICASIKSNDYAENFSDLDDSSVSLCKRVRYARLKSGNISYWEKQLNTTKNLVFKLAIILTWGSPKTLIKLFFYLNEKVSDLNPDEFKSLYKILFRTCDVSQMKTNQSKEVVSFLKKQDNAGLIKFLISFRFREEIRFDLITTEIKNFNDFSNEEINRTILDSLVNQYLLNQTDNIDLLREIERYYSLVVNYEFNEYLFYKMYNHHNFKEIPIDIAKKIMEKAKLYPRIIASIAEKSCRQFYNDNIIPVGKIALENLWFD